jgi:LytS/YehU family sensor histidine kinase
MSESTRQRILNCEVFGNEKSGHTTGIGIANVVQRLRLFYGIEDVIEIESSPSSGTKMVLKLPLYTPYQYSAGEEIDKNV